MTQHQDLERFSVGPGSLKAIRRDPDGAYVRHSNALAAIERERERADRLGEAADQATSERDQAERLANEADRYREALEEAQGDAYLWQIDEGPWAEDPPALIEHLRKIARDALQTNDQGESPVGAGRSPSQAEGGRSDSPDPRTSNADLTSSEPCPFHSKCVCKEDCTICRKREEEDRGVGIFPPPTQEKCGGLDQREIDRAEELIAEGKLPDECPTCGNSRRVIVTEPTGEHPEPSFHQACPDCVYAYPEAERMVRESQPQDPTGVLEKTIEEFEKRADLARKDRDSTYRGTKDVRIVTGHRFDAERKAFEWAARYLRDQLGGGG